MESLFRNSYNREEAVRYALRYALSPNPGYKYFKSLPNVDGGGDCTNFISQCLFAGGAKMAFGGQWPWWYRPGTGQTWSYSWTIAHSLYWTLKSRFQLKLGGLMAQEVSDVSLLELGDLIQYEKKNKIYHSTIITNFTHRDGKRYPLISQHTLNLRDTWYIKPAADKMHFMKIIIS